MPPHAVKTVKDLIFYQYAKIIASSAKIPGHGFIMSTMKKLSSGEMKMSTVLRELKIQMTCNENCCEYCNSTEGLSWDHLVPRVKNGPDTAENHVLACRHCNSSKGCKGIYEWYGIERKDKLPRLIAGKYLKLLYEIHEKNGTLHEADLNGDGVLDVFDLETF
ncbi:MAG: HNH endonuclease signature motif containing protein [Chlamydiales bacterium]|nr:HNH endonuclease signature motif containing protein [Chlamydiales bacterium]